MAVTGVVTFARIHDLVLHDGQEGVYVSLSKMSAVKRREAFSENGKPQVGAKLEVQGHTSPGGYAPVITALQITRMGDAPLPPPQPVSLSAVTRGQFDCQSVELRGVGRRVHRSDPEEGELRMEIATPDGNFSAMVMSSLGFNPQELIDASLLLRGVAFTFFTTRGEANGVLLRVIDARNIEITRPAAPDPFNVPEVDPLALRPFRKTGPVLHRQKLTGTVTMERPGDFFYVQMADRAVRVNTRSTEPLTAGDIVDVSGFVDYSRDFGAMTEALYRSAGQQTPVLPAAVTRQLVLGTTHRGIDILRVEDYDGRLVTIRGKFVDIETNTGADSRVFLDCDGGIVVASLPERDAARAAEQLLRSNEVELTGIFSVELSTNWPALTLPRPKGFTLLLQDRSFIRVLEQKSWWTPVRLWTALGIALVALGITLALVAILRRRIAERSALLADEMRARRDGEVEFAATLRERERLSADLHDTLEQTLTGVALQIHATSSATTPERAARNLELATAMLSRSREELRRSVWNLRSHDLEGRLLREALDHICRSILDGTGITLKVGGTGTEEALSDFTAGNLLLMTKEALSNAIKHAAPSTITIEVNYTRDDVTIKVTDNGCGFDPAAAPGRHDGHFGLTGLRERALRIDAQLDIHSTHGSGTTVIIFVPNCIPR